MVRLFYLIVLSSSLLFLTQRKINKVIKSPWKTETTTLGRKQTKEDEEKEKQKEKEKREEEEEKKK